ncbi:trimeric intracellular cation channel family protein [Endozoicomonas atrinae]|uniref:trimeric intracellular cation channel family protein n=2 Tax=Endozoicomonas atrinae TaxID=1333660 RepID=UPI000825029B|nr:trimeric intracellular cation channel family protein [Endozoicomonas atrinae]
MLTVLYVIAITAEAMTGALSAGRRGMDPVGVIFVACCTAIGGGSVRDMLLGSYPLTWVETPMYIVITTVAAILTIFLQRYMKHMFKVFLVLDAVGLITFSIIGAQKTLDLGHGYIIASVMAVITGVFGGILRDILCNNVPLVFRKELYASVALISIGFYFALQLLEVNPTVTVISTLVFGFIFRMIAVRFKLELPKFVYKESAH